MNKFRIVTTIILAVILGFAYFAFDGVEDTQVVTPTAVQEQGGGYSGMGK